MEGPLGIFLAFLLIGCALLLSTIRALGIWRRSRQKPRNWDEWHHRTMTYGLFGFVMFGSLTAIIVGLVGIASSFGRVT